MNHLCEFLSEIKMTVISGIMLALSFILSITGTEVIIDPAWVSILISGIPLMYGAVRKLTLNKGISRISSALLISVAIISAVCIGDIFAGGEVAFIMAIGEILEDKTTARARKGLKNLISLAPIEGRVITQDGEKTVRVNDIKTGDTVRILPGEVIPIDGEIISGESSIDQSVMTGESLPIDKSVGDSVFSGTINRFGSIDIKVTKLGEDSSLNKLIRMVEEADKKKAPTQRIADKWASYLVPLAMLIAIITYFATGDIVRGVTVLVVFCPCALVLATPTAIMAAIGQATKRGIIIKSGEALEKMGKVDTVSFDKTGTITKGILSLTDIIPLSPDITENELLTITASAELLSEHPLATAIVSHAKNIGISPTTPESFKMTSGKGIISQVEGRTVICGNEAFLSENGIVLDNISQDKLQSLQKSGKGSLIIAIDGTTAGIIALTDTLREESKKTVDALHDMGISAVLLTGDNKHTAQFIANDCGIDEVYSQLMPEEKVSKLLEMENSGKCVCMLGDGINDAPALKSAYVGIAMGGEGCDIAVEASEITLMNDDISKIPYLKKLSNETVKTIRSGICLSLLINLVAIILSFLGMLTPTTGALVHNAGSIFVILMASFLYDRKF